MLHYELQGKTLAFTSTPKIVYLGLPELWCLDNKSKVDRPLLAKLAQSPAAWQTLTANQQGIYELCLQDEHGDLLFHSTCALLPEDFSISFLPIARRIELRHSEHAYVSCDSPLVSNIQATATGRSIELNSTDSLPDNIELILRWTGSREKLLINVPCATQPKVTEAKPIIVTDDQALEALCLENEQLNAIIDQLTQTLKKRDAALCLLLSEVKQLNSKIQVLRSLIQAKNAGL
jgi:hypothetical protein